MAFNGSGVYSVIYTWVQDAANGINITASRFDTQDGDMATAFNNCLTRDGQGAPSTALTWTQPLTINSVSGAAFRGVGNSAAAFTSSSGAGFYSAGTGVVGLAMNSAGANSGIAQNDSADHWSLSAGATPTSLGTPIFGWSYASSVPQLQGRGPVAAALVDMTPDSSSFTATFSGGYTSNPTGTINWRRQGNFVSLWVPTQIQGTSNATTDITISGLPASITPATTGRAGLCSDVINASGGGYVARYAVTTSNTIILSLLSGAFSSTFVGATPGSTFTGSGTKGVSAGWSIGYSI